MRRKKICLFGGTFDPVHTGHLILADCAREHFGFDAVVFIPAFLPPHKSSSSASGADRLKMLRLAVRGNPFFSVCDFELRQRGVSYTHRTVRHFLQKHPGAELYFLIGADLLPGLHTWREADYLFQNLSFAVGHRGGYKIGNPAGQCAKIPPAFRKTLLGNVFVAPRIEISSTDVRRRAARSESIRYLVPERVERYIHEKSLYQKAGRRRQTRG